MGTVFTHSIKCVCSECKRITRAHQITERGMATKKEYLFNIGNPIYQCQYCGQVNYDSFL